MNNIKKIRKEIGISVTELAAQLNMSQGNLTKIENNQIELKPDIATKIAEALGVSVQAITTNIASSEALSEYTLINPETVNLPLLSRLSLPKTFIHSNENTAIALFVQTDDTMTPLIPNNAIVLIDKNNREISNGVFLVKINNRVYLRRLQTTFTAETYLLCDNSAYHPQTVDITSIEIIGKALSYLSHNII